MCLLVKISRGCSQSNRGDLGQPIRGYMNNVSMGLVFGVWWTTWTFGLVIFASIQGIGQMDTRWTWTKAKWWSRWSIPQARHYKTCWRPTSDARSQMVLFKHHWISLVLTAGQHQTMQSIGQQLGFWSFTGLVRCSQEAFTESSMGTIHQGNHYSPD